MTRRANSFETRPGYPATVPGFLTPPLLWALYFVLIYSLHGMVCVGGMQGAVAGVDTLSAIIVAMTAVAMLGHGGLGLWAYRVWRRIRRHGEADIRDALIRASFLAYAALLNAGLFFVATLWIGLPALMLDPCL